MNLEFTASEVKLLIERFVNLSVDVNIREGNTVEVSKFFITAAFKHISVKGNSIVLEGNTVANILQKLVTTFNESAKPMIYRHEDNMVIALDQIPEMRNFLHKFTIQSVDMETKGVIKVNVFCNTGTF